MRRTVIAGNWKLNPPPARGTELLEELGRGLASRSPLPRGLEVWILPPSPYLGFLRERAKGRDAEGVRIGAQDLSARPYGAHTGEVGGELLRDFGCALALVGHSERRQAGESDETVAEKARAADRVGLVPLLCVGESDAERAAGKTIGVVERQLAAVTAALRPERPLWLAYEPVWAIGTGKNATPEQAIEVHRALRAALARAGRDAAGTPVLYGGSVKPANAAALLASEEIDGALVGGASLEAQGFLAIVDAAIAAKRKARS